MAALKTRVTTVLAKLRKRYHNTPFSARLENPFRCLVATMLSHRTRDEKTELASRKLFKQYDSSRALSRAPVKKIEALIRDVGFYRVKARRVKQVAGIIERKFGGRVPRDLNALLKLPGVGRKTAQCVLVYAFREPALPVDSHVAVVSRRLGWSRAKTPEGVEKDLKKIVPRQRWIEVNELFVLHGQNVCLTARPRCEKCFLTRFCDYYSRLKGGKTK